MRLLTLPARALRRLLDRTMLPAPLCRNDAFFFSVLPL
jgi:hypothetical protein